MYEKRLSRRELLGLAAATTTAMVLSACGATATPETKATVQATTAGATAATATPAAASQKAVTLQYFFETGAKPANVDYMTKLGTQYTTKVPNVKIEAVVAPQGLTSDQKLETMIAGGTPPDIVYSGATVSMAARGAYLNLFPLLEKSGKSIQDQHPNAQKVYTIKGGSFLWGLPNHLSTHFLVVNKTLFDKAGVKVPSADWGNADWTWDAYLEAAKSNTKREGDTTAAWGCFPLDGHLFYSGPYMYGGRWYDEKTNQCTIDDEKAYKCFQFDHDVVFKDKVAPNAAQSKTLEAGFMTGKIAAYMDGPWSIVTYTTIKDFEWTLAPVPYAKELGVKASRMNSAFCNSCAIASKNNIDAAWDFMLWLNYDEEVYANWSWYGAARLPSRVAAQNKWMEMATKEYPNVAWSVYVGAYDYASPDWSATQANASKLSDLIQAEMIDPINGDEKADAKELAVAIKPKIQALLETV